MFLLVGFRAQLHMNTSYQILEKIFKKSLLEKLKKKSINSSDEVCGFISKGVFWEKQNIHPDKKNFFLISPEDCCWGDGVILFHSHPKHVHAKGFSKWDIDNQYYFDLDMLLYSVNNDEFYFKKI